MISPLRFVIGHSVVVYDAINGRSDLRVTAHTNLKNVCSGNIIEIILKKDTYVRSGTGKFWVNVIYLTVFSLNAYVAVVFVS